MQHFIFEVFVIIHISWTLHCKVKVMEVFEVLCMISDIFDNYENFYIWCSNPFYKSLFFLHGKDVSQKCNIANFLLNTNGM